MAKYLYEVEVEITGLPNNSEATKEISSILKDWGMTVNYIDCDEDLDYWIGTKTIDTHDTLLSSSEFPNRNYILSLAHQELKKLIPDYEVITKWKNAEDIWDIVFNNIGIPI